MTELQRRVRELNKKHPEWNWCKIAKAAGCSRVSVGRILGKSPHAPGKNNPRGLQVSKDMNELLDDVFNRVIGPDWDMDHD